ncbi:MAG: HlyD family efflux transporter periplasmic adaptor subunit [Candidatus Symbiothrix sp.]|jgi:HlyD family secretion protein|nr:HlyD family efflux transporter periplasmic adaptor subunit [Candidatus Symbiothrix sp.]
MNTNKTMTLCILLFVVTSCGNKKGKSDASGTFEASEVVVSAQAAGQILQFDIAEGQTLEANQSAGYIDTLQLHLKKEQLQASMKAVNSRTYNVAVQIASLKQQIAKQQTELSRFQKLQQANATTQKQVDDIQSSIDVLQKQLAAQTDALQNGNSSLSSEIAALQIQVEQVEDLIAKSLITAPVSGTVLSKYAEKGELAAQGKPLFKMANLDDLYLRAYIVAEQLTQLKLNQKVSVFADFGRKELNEYKGEITWISDKAEFTPRTILTKNERANQVYAVKIAVKNDGYLKIGMYGEVRFGSNLR